MVDLINSVEKSIIDFVHERFNVDVCSSEHDLIEAGILDSLMIVDLVLYFEQQFGTSLSLEDLEIENFASVSRMAALVAGQARHTSKPQGRLSAA
jgi:acyl carrier protein